jgi:hypothetical protein
VLFVIALAAAGLALVLYLRIEGVGRAGLPLAALRAASWGAVAALLVNPSCRRAGGAGPTVLLDASRSMSDPTGEARWRAAVDSARAVAGRDGRIMLFGEEPRSFLLDATPGAAASRLAPALREAAARGGPVAVVTDGAIDDAGLLPGDLLRRARVVILPRPAGPDVGVAALELPATLREGDTAVAVVDLLATQTGPGDSVMVELFEGSRRVARARVALGAGGSLRRELAVVPAAVAGEREIRRYEVRLSGLATDIEPRDDTRATVAAVTRGSTVVLLSDSPDWDARALAATLSATAGVPVRTLVRPAGQWLDARTLRPVDETTLRAEASRAALVIAHGTEAGVEALARLARRGLWRWVTTPRGAAPPPGDWYAMAPEAASPVGGALAAVPVESLPPLEAVLEAPADTAGWVALAARLDRRGRPRAVLTGAESAERRVVAVAGSGLWRWAGKGGVSAEAYRALIAALTDWLLEAGPGAQAALASTRDSLARGLAEYLPRPPVLAAQPGVVGEGERERVPLRHARWPYGLALGALVLEWVARRRRGLR